MKREPVLVKGERVWRTYLGGREIEKLHKDGTDGSAAADSHFPEEWMYSVTRAFNAGREEIEEGLCYLKQEERQSLKDYIEAAPEEILGKAHTERWGSTPGVLIKIIDSKERLTVQVHPDQETAQRLFGSPFGKTECWHILGTREDTEEPPCIYLGFREGITRQQWEECFETQDYPRMLGLMNRLEVKPGETYLVKGGVPHAIGAACMLIEIQEPTDYTIRVEKVTPSGFRIDDRMCHQGLGFQGMFDCFHYEGNSEAEIRRKYCIESRVREDGGLRLVGYEDTPCFQMDQYTVETERWFSGESVFSCIYILSGTGILKTESEDQNQEPGTQNQEPGIQNSESGTRNPSSGQYRIARNTQIFVPADSKKYCIINQGNTPVKMLKMYGPL